jgi:hypothetical protein
MKIRIVSVLLVGTFLAGEIFAAKPIPVKWKLRSGVSWSGYLYGRDGNWISLKRPQDPKPVRVGASTIKQISFKVDFDLDKVAKLAEEKKYNELIVFLENKLGVLNEYADLPTNLSPYNKYLMEAYYQVNDYKKTLTIASRFARKAGDPELKEKSRVFQVLSLVSLEKLHRAQALVGEYGWEQGDEKKMSAETLYILARLKVLEKKYTKAMLYLAKVIAFHSQEMEWMPPAELLCAETYVEMKLYDSAEEVCDEIGLLYKGSPEFAKAIKLKIKIKELRNR